MICGGNTVRAYGCTTRSTSRREALGSGRRIPPQMHHVANRKLAKLEMIIQDNIQYSEDKIVATLITESENAILIKVKCTVRIKKGT